jgi:hypothetical protein
VQTEQGGWGNSSSDRTPSSVHKNKTGQRRRVAQGRRWEVAASYGGAGTREPLGG